jgi:hypothetical protein
MYTIEEFVERAVEHARSQARISCDDGERVGETTFTQDSRYSQSVSASQPAIRAKL